jgi:hypothetical protein
VIRLAAINHLRAKSNGCGSDDLNAAHGLKEGLKAPVHHAAQPTATDLHVRHTPSKMPGLADTQSRPVATVVEAVRVFHGVAELVHALHRRELLLDIDTSVSRDGIVATSPFLTHPAHGKVRRFLLRSPC